MRLVKAILKLLVALLLAAAIVVPALLWWTYPKRTAVGPFVRVAADAGFRFSDLPRGRVLAPAEVDGYARRLLAAMTLQQKVLQMSGDTSLWELVRLVTIERGKYNDRPITAGEDRRLAIPPIAFSDGPRGVAMNHSTCFPSAMARGATFDRELQRRVADAVAKEIRAQGANLWGGLCVNLLRHPGWGRAQETLGEDPYLVGELALAQVGALQAHNVMGCAKHFALNSIEETRTRVDVRVDERTLREVYLPHFEKLARADVASFMTSYNRVNGAYTAENAHLLRELLKGEWAFRGFVMSDFFMGVHDPRRGALAGLDLEMPWTRVYGRRLQAAVAAGEVPLALIDDAVLRLLRRKIEYATRPDPIRYRPELVRHPAHVALAREVAEKAIVLLKNERGVLPLDRRATARLAVFGRLAEALNLGDYGSSRVYPPSSVTVLQGLRDALGAARIAHDPGAELAQARAVARTADAAVVVVGLDHSDEGEYIPQKPEPAERGGDREELALRAADRELVEAVAAENPRTVVVLVGGAAITVEEWQQRVPAIAFAFYPGEQGGAAVARVLFGDADPGGRLPFTWPKDPSQLPPFDNRSPSVEYGYYHGYTLADKRGLEPRWPFGHGLGYTTYRHAGLSLDAPSVRADGTLTASVEVTNTGSRAGEEVVQLYVGFPASRVDRPLKLLRGFERVALAPGETRRVAIQVKAADLAYYDVGTKAWVVERTRYAVIEGPSSRGPGLLEARFDVVD